MAIAVSIIVVLVVVAFAATLGLYLGSVTGMLVLDLQWRRRVRPLGPQHRNIAAPPDIVYSLLAQPYLGRATRALAGKVRVIERGQDLVLAAHRTAIRGHLVATTIETVKFTDGQRIDVRLLRGPVPHVTETFTITPTPTGCVLAYDGELGTDLGAVGAWWGRVVARRWEATVAATVDTIQAEAERRSR
jgi:hypothetical protein